MKKSFWLKLLLVVLICAFIWIFKWFFIGVLVIMLIGVVLWYLIRNRFRKDKDSDG